jgi:predicted adenine nucleotide alpha hydrolase (AANH) superfamily ATPase
VKLLLHVCCGPCTLYPLRVLRDEGIEVSGYFYNPNIHPYREFKRRIGALVELAEQKKFAVEIDRNYGLREYLRRVVFHEDERCGLCYDMRLEQAARRAAELGMDGYSTTLLYSRYQNHALIREKCAALADRFGVSFLYRDFRTGWQEGIDESIAMNLYRQPYCGCIYSEQERYDKKWRKEQRKQRKNKDKPATVRKCDV